MKINKQAFGVILSGGLSRRMGSDKSKMKIQNHTLIELVIEKAKKQLCTLAINSNKPNDLVDNKYNLEIFEDSIKGNLGPLAGILSGMEWAREKDKQCKWVVFFPVDSPFFPDNLVEKFFEGLVNEKIVVAKSGERIHPVFSMWNIELIDLLRQSLKNNERKIDNFTKKLNSRLVKFPIISYDPFFNVNYPSDLIKANKIFELQNSIGDKLQ